MRRRDKVAIVVTFLNEGSEQYRPLCGSCSSAQIIKRKIKEIYSSTEEEMTFWTVCAKLIAVQMK